MNLSLILWLFLFLFDFSSQNFQELWLQEHFFDGDENFQNQLKDLTNGEFETDSIRNDDLVVNAFVAIERNDVVEFSIDFFELLSNELFEEEDLSVFVDVEKSIDIGSHRSPDLPSVGVLQEIQAVGIRMDVVELTNVDKVFTLDQH
jgi:hypothetical protein